MRRHAAIDEAPHAHRDLFDFAIRIGRDEGRPLDGVAGIRWSVLAERLEVGRQRQIARRVDAHGVDGRRCDERAQKRGPAVLQVLEPDDADLAAAVQPSGESVRVRPDGAGGVDQAIAAIACAGLFQEFRIAPVDPGDVGIAATLEVVVAGGSSRLIANFNV
jgi:hypothetical protein